MLQKTTSPNGSRFISHPGEHVKPDSARETTFLRGVSQYTHSHSWGQPELAAGGRRRCPRRGGDAMSTHSGTWLTKSTAVWLGKKKFRLPPHSEFCC